jgi:pimeloyl-ACP methyl ester carboxylesterase
VKSTLFIRGRTSEFIIDEDVHVVGRYFTNFLMETINNADHWLHVDASERTSEVILDFLQQPSPLAIAAR